MCACVFIYNSNSNGLPRRKGAVETAGARLVEVAQRHHVRHVIAPHVVAWLGRWRLGTASRICFVLQRLVTALPIIVSLGGAYIGTALLICSLAVRDRLPKMHLRRLWTALFPFAARSAFSWQFRSQPCAVVVRAPGWNERGRHGGVQARPPLGNWVPRFMGHSFSKVGTPQKK